MLSGIQLCEVPSARVLPALVASAIVTAPRRLVERIGYARAAVPRIVAETSGVITRVPRPAQVPRFIVTEPGPGFLGGREGLDLVGLAEIPVITVDHILVHRREGVFDAVGGVEERVRPV